MVRVTESAIALLRDLKGQYSAPNQFLRIVTDEETRGFRLVVGDLQAGDELVEDDGVSIAGIDAKVASALSQASLVAQMTQDGQQLAANTPQPYPFGAISEIIRLPS